MATMTRPAKTDPQSRYDRLFARLWERYSDDEQIASPIRVELREAQAKVKLLSDPGLYGSWLRESRRKAADRLAKAEIAAFTAIEQIKRAERGQRLAARLDRALANLVSTD